MIGPLNSYQDIYVAGCGQQFTTHKAGREHEKECRECQRPDAEVSQQQQTQNVADGLRLAFERYVNDYRTLPILGASVELACKRLAELQNIINETEGKST